MAKAGVVYVGTDDGVVIFGDPASIGRWRKIGHELSGVATRAIVSHSALVVDAAMAGAGVQHSSDGGQSWQQIRTEDVVALATHAERPETIVVATQAGAIQHSNDSGTTWQTFAQGNLPSHATVRLLIDPHMPDRVLVAIQDSGVWARDDAQAWKNIGNLQGHIETLVASPGRQGTLFALVDGTLWSTTQDEWTQTGGTPPAKLSGAIAVLPGKTEVLLAATRNDAGEAIFVRSDDDGVNWQTATSQEPLETAITVIMPAAYHIDTAWAGTEDGRLLLSDDRGRSWRTIARDLAAIRALAAVRLA